jgi:hypothetical protein
VCVCVCVRASVKCVWSVCKYVRVCVCVCVCVPALECELNRSGVRRSSEANCVICEGGGVKVACAGL